ncbi:hypothetical protein HDV01_001958 [Terramyces sp. JEL0728]|nr:hypothetical protein HDV01_001958 [Terramyces sp. JEL0728]
MHNGHFIDITGVSEVRGRIMCKSPHRYSYDTLFPLVRTTYEGVPTWRPNNVPTLLKAEYKNKNTYKNYKFNDTTGGWDQVGPPPKPKIIKQTGAVKQTIPKIYSADTQTKIFNRPYTFATYPEFNYTLEITPKVPTAPANLAKHESIYINPYYPYYVPAGTALYVEKSLLAVLEIPEDELLEDKRHFSIQNFDFPHENAMADLLESFAIWADSIQLPYWLSHQTLAGYHFGGKILPWCRQLTVQTPANSLYQFLTLPTLKMGNLELEINPHFPIRTNQTNNIADARFVDHEKGIFIEIRGVSLIKGRVQDKSGMKYKFTDVFPLVRSTFEGIPTWRPQSYKSILDVDQPWWKSGTSNHYKYHPMLDAWVGAKPKSLA